MGASLNLQPDLYKAAILGVPFVDVLTTMLDDTIPLTTTEVGASAATENVQLQMHFVWFQAWYAVMSGRGVPFEGI